ncbi:MAG: histidine kinase, partial [Candidatus Aminicenantes bacterium]|nr:histidine kinase [Candidatus Aminicenantes bacterium]NIM78380.1 histidine kinase [Candidatus Aminicenantes bacterium]NIN17633.1 histidine kinase [Candidatus Aminicenantes bacterium]NIN41509.1 histidine kinase [Candidatus Aminicenantes bacterium]NIN84283.1 histidine kinase [Candidatus Aminicenantes bacterium]
MYDKRGQREMVLKGILGIVVLGLLFLISPGLYSKDAGFKYLKNYSYGEYDHHPQNWGMVQAKNGIIYVANQAGVLEFDGVSWRVIYDPPSKVRSIAIDEAGTIYIGGIGEIGYLAPDEKGTLEYHSLLGYLPEKQKNFLDVWKTYASEKGVYFHTSKFLFRWDSRQMKVWEPRERFLFPFMCEGKLFVRPKTVGLMEMVNDSLKKVPGGEMFIERKIFMMVPYGSKRVLIGTREHGFYIYDGTTIMPFPTEVADYLKKNQLYHG